MIFLFFFYFLKERRKKRGWKVQVWARLTGATARAHGDDGLHGCMHL